MANVQTIDWVDPFSFQSRSWFARDPLVCFTRLFSTRSFVGPAALRLDPLAFWTRCDRLAHEIRYSPESARSFDPLLPGQMGRSCARSCILFSISCIQLFFYIVFAYCTLKIYEAFILNSIRALVGAMYDGLKSPLVTCNQIITTTVLSETLRWWKGCCVC